MPGTVLFKIGLFFSACFFTATLFAAELYTSFDDIQKTAKEFLTKNVPLEADDKLDIRVNPVYPPLRVAMCSKPLEAALPTDSNKNQITAVEMSCNGIEAWHVLVPVEVKVNTKVFVARHMIPSHQAITEDDLDLAEYDRNQLYSGFFKNKEDIVGQVAAQTISAGAVLTKRNIQLPVLVHREQIVDIVARSNSVVVSMQGIAKSDGSLNQAVKVYNPSSKRTLDAIVIGESKAEVIS